MPNSISQSIDSALGVHQSALLYRGERSRVLASNLANADTPNYKARDLSFAKVMSANNNMSQGERQRVALRATHQDHMRMPGETSDWQLKYRLPYQPALDGNTVEAEVEQAKFARNAVEYQASLTLLSGRIRGIKDALQSDR